jgi:hypothetical protein
LALIACLSACKDARVQTYEKGLERLA